MKPRDQQRVNDRRANVERALLRSRGKETRRLTKIFKRSGKLPVCLPNRHKLAACGYGSMSASRQANQTGKWLLISLQLVAAVCLEQ